MLAIWLALVVSACLGTADFIAGLKTRQRPVVAVLLISQTVGLLLLVPAIAIQADGPPPLEYVGYAALAGISASVGATSLYRGLAAGQMSIVAPISATAATIPIAFGVLTGDRLSAAQALGIGVALVGVMLAGWAHAQTSRAGSSGREPRGAPRLGAGVGFALLAALGGGFFLVAIDAASDGDVLWAALAARVTLLGLLVVAAVGMHLPAATLRADRGLVAVGVLEVSSWVMLAVATTHGLLSLVGLLVSLYPVVTILLARALLSERMSPPQKLGVGLVLIALALIALG